MNTAQNNSKNYEFGKFFLFITSNSVLALLLVIATESGIIQFFHIFGIHLVSAIIVVTSITLSTVTVFFVLQTFKKNSALRVQTEQENQKSMLKLLSDLSTQKTKLEQEKTRLETILASIGEGVFVTDIQGKIILLNKAAEKLSGFTMEECNGKYYLDIFNFILEDGEKYPPFIEGVVKTGNAHELGKNVSLLRRDGSKIPVADSAAPIKNERGEVYGCVVALRDVTHEREIDRMKTEFVSVASHELRTPLTAIDGIVSMILDGEYGPITENLKQPLEDVNISSVRLIHLVNDLLNVSRIEEGRMKYSLSDFLISGVIDETIELLQPIVKEKNIILSKGECPQANVQGDIDKVKQILNNLLGNSLKFTDSGSITVSVKQNNDFMIVAVTDTGIGIASEDRAKLFGKFQQLNSGKGRPMGTGLGLHISKEMAQKMGGDVWLERSDAGKGSTFIFSVPIARSNIARQTKEAVEKEAKEKPDQKSDTIGQTIS